MTTATRTSRLTAPLPSAAVSALARLERAFAPAPVDPAVRMSAVSAECRRLSATAEALLKRWRCRHCDTWNAPGDRRCHCCGSKAAS